MYTRARVCTLAGMDPERFKSLARRDQLPTNFVPIGKHKGDDNIQDEIRTRGWNRFSNFDAACIAVTNALASQMGYADGLTHATASKVVSCNSGAITEALENSKATPNASDIWVGYVAYGNGGGANRAGDLASIALTLLAELNAGEQVARVFAVNVSDVLRTMRQRATEAGFQFPAKGDDDDD
jgi:hypothetical protein